MNKKLIEMGSEVLCRQTVTLQPCSKTMQDGPFLNLALKKARLFNQIVADTSQCYVLCYMHLLQTSIDKDSNMTQAELKHFIIKINGYKWKTKVICELNQKSTAFLEHAAVITKISIAA